MKKVTTILLIILFQVASGQAESGISIFQRLLVFNTQNELLVVKIENTDFWVTPGLYQTKEQSIKMGLDSIAATYGLKLKEYKLNGTFILKRQLNGESSTSLRNVFTVKTSGGITNKPNAIEEIKWVSISEAMELITFPHMIKMIKQIVSNPKEIWGGTLLQYKENDKWRAKVLEEFYTM